MRREFIGYGPLVTRLIQAATDREPWATWAFVSIDDWIRHGLRGDHYKIPIPKPLIGSAEMFRRFTHPLSRERLKEMAREAMETTHILTVEPYRYVVRGEFWIGEYPAMPDRPRPCADCDGVHL